MIKVEIHNGKLDEIHHEILIGERICKTLQEAGIPAEGVFTVRSVRTGSLTYVRDDVTDVHKFEWREDEDDRDTKGFVRSVLPKSGAVTYRNGRHIQKVLTPTEDDEL